MKCSEFERILKSQGYELVRNSGHKIFSNGMSQIAVPHAKQINRLLARRLLKEISYATNVPELNYIFKSVG